MAKSINDRLDVRKYSNVRLLWIVFPGPGNEKE